MNVDTQLPRDFETLRQRVLEHRQTLPKRLAQVAAYAIDNPDEIAFGTAASIAAAAGVQPSTLIRFAQHLGYDGFTSLQLVFRERLRGRTLSYDERLAALSPAGRNGSESRAILDGFVAAATKSLDMMTTSIRDQELEKAVGLLAGAETIYVLARRRSYPVAGYMAYAFAKLRIRAHVVESPAGLDPELLSFATPRDAAIAVSFSPYASSTVDAAHLLADQGVPVVAITDSAFSPLAQSARVWFDVAEADCAGFRSLSATMALAMTLTVAVAEKRRSAA